MLDISILDKRKRQGVAPHVLHAQLALPPLTGRPTYVACVRVCTAVPQSTHLRAPSSTKIAPMFPYKRGADLLSSPPLPLTEPVSHATPPMFPLRRSPSLGHLTTPPPLCVGPRVVPSLGATLRATLVPSLRWSTAGDLSRYRQVPSLVSHPVGATSPPFLLCGTLTTLHSHVGPPKSPSNLFTIARASGRRLSRVSCVGPPGRAIFNQACWSSREPGHKVRFGPICGFDFQFIF
jgi:hypothetical protein